MFLIAFSGFFRSSELCLFRSGEHVQFSSSYVTIFIEKSRLEVSNLCPYVLKPFLLLSRMGLADRRAHASKCCFVCSVV